MYCTQWSRFKVFYVGARCLTADTRTRAQLSPWVTLNCVHATAPLTALRLFQLGYFCVKLTFFALTHIVLCFDTILCHKKLGILINVLAVYLVQKLEFSLNCACMQECRKWHVSYWNNGKGIIAQSHYATVLNSQWTILLNVWLTALSQQCKATLAEKR